MLRAVAQLILSGAGLIAGLFISPNSANFDFIQMGVALLMIIIVALAIWYLPQIFNRDHHR